MRHDNFIPVLREVELHHRGRLVHWWADDAIYFVTFRLADALPRNIARELAAERDRLLKTADTRAQEAVILRMYGEQLDKHLDRGYGSCLLREHGQIVADALLHFNGVRYQLHAWCVMPNHVHVLVHLTRGADLPRTLHSWKSFTAHVINCGHIWQFEYYDRCIRTPREHADTAEYIRRNPEAAGLRDWKWVG
ncbi:MAG: hypothetical protein QOH21_2640 [Acidobacteriota bacterium]|jgi:REP element-mobilizing transposase RayT|nr:hypothetical protein [Acidobacteriota bacterium]